MRCNSGRSHPGSASRCRASTRRVDSTTSRPWRCVGALDDHGLLLFRDVDIDTRTQYRLACLLADDGRDDPAVESRPTYVSNRVPDSITPFGRLPFHTDLIWGEYPFRIVSLFAIEVAPPVVPTVFASAIDAWDTLPAELRAIVDGREALQASGQHMVGEDIVQLHHVHQHSRTTPIGFPHPRNGRTILLVDQQSTVEVVGMTPEESAEVLDALRSHLYRPEVVLSHEWREGDLVAVGQPRRPARPRQRRGRGCRPHPAAGVQRCPGPHRRRGDPLRAGRDSSDMTTRRLWPDPRGAR